MRSRLSFLALLLVLAGCARAPVAPAAAVASPPAGGAIEQTQKKVAEDRHQRIYRFEHCVLPHWVHQSDGQFFRDLATGVPDRMRSTAAKVVDQVFADKMKLEAVDGMDGYLLSFERPTDVPECYYAAIVRQGTGFGYFTCEKSFSLSGAKGPVTVLGTWLPDGAHGNLGMRGYDDATSFVKDVRQALAAATKTE